MTVAILQLIFCFFFKTAHIWLLKGCVEIIKDGFVSCISLLSLIAIILFTELLIFARFPESESEA